MEDSYPQVSTTQPARTTPQPKPGRRGLSLPSWKTIISLATFIGRRLAFGVVVLLAVIYLTYFGLALVRDTPFLTATGQAGVQTGHYLVRLSQGDMGITRQGGVGSRMVPVTQLLFQVTSRSLGLLGAAFLISILIGTPLGAWAAVRRNSKGSLLLVLASMVGIATPSFFAALFLQIAAIRYTRYFGRSLVSVGGFGWDSHLVLPMLVLAARPVAQIARVTYVSLSDVFDQDYVRTAYSKGLRADHVFYVHILRNAAVPILTTIAVSLRFALSSLPVVEVYFGWGGIGQRLLGSIFGGDSDMTIALFLVLGALFILVNLLLEISYSLIDPRLREQNGSTIRKNRAGLRSVFTSAVEELRGLLVGNPLVDWLRERFSNPEASSDSEFGFLLEGEGDLPESADETPLGDNSRWRALRRGLLGNFPLMIGSVLVLALLFLTLFGPRLAPYSPNTTQLITSVDGVLTTPPFPPSAEHPWGTDPIGRDMLSLILAGVQQTMILALLVVGARMLIGFVLGTLAGWFYETWLDRFLVGLTQAIAVFPTLLLAALLIFIIGIQGGMKTFLLALSLVGWGEIMQFVRGQVASIRPKPFIESAVAIGQRTSRLILSHVLPNIAPALISVAALEVGAVLLILGELGFLGIFIRGGASSDFGLYAQVPEWGALLSGVRTWTRSYPWTGFFPTVAFFIAILGFTLLGEGIRRLVSEVGLVLRRLVNPYTIALSGLMVVGFVWARSNTGEIVFYRQQAATFDEQNAMAYLEDLVDPELEGRALDSPGLTTTAEYIQDQFRSLGLQPAGESMTFFQPGQRTFQTLDANPSLTLDDGAEAPVYLEDFTVYPGPTQNLGQAQGRVRFLAWGQDAPPANLDFSESVLLLPKAEMLPALGNRACRGVLILANELSEVKRRYTYSSQPPQGGCGDDTPVLWVSESLGSRLIRSSDRNIRALLEEAENLKAEDMIDIPLDVTAAIDIQGHVEANVPVMNVVGQMPGTSADLDSNLIVVAAQYDAPPRGNRQVYPGANDNASGVAVMMEAIRTMKESGYQPFKTFLFVAYSGEGLPDLSPAPPVESYLQSRVGFDTAFDIQGVIYLRGLGLGGENKLGIYSWKRNDFSKTLESATHLAGVQTERVGSDPVMQLFKPIRDSGGESTDYPRVGISRFGWETGARLSTDTRTFITSQDLGKAGEAVSLGLMIVGR
jgi:peptide/nickel transport system permease protein